MRCAHGQIANCFRAFNINFITERKRACGIAVSWPAPKSAVTPEK